MAHSLFEPPPAPLPERLWRRLKAFNPVTSSGPRAPSEYSAPARLDARGQQLLLARTYGPEKT